MYYKTKRTSETGLKFKAIEDKSEIAKKEAKDFSKKYGFSKYRGGYWCVFGGITSCVDFKETPDKKIWGKGAKNGEYMPKRNIKAGKEIAKEIDNLTTVSYDELNDCIGMTREPFRHIGFSFKNNEYFGFETDNEWNIEIPKDCEEILFSEYKKLFK